MELFRYPHLLLLQIHNSILNCLVGGYDKVNQVSNCSLKLGLRLPNEEILGRFKRLVLWYAIDVGCLKRKLSSKLSVGEVGRGPEWEVCRFSMQDFACLI